MDERSVPAHRGAAAVYASAVLVLLLALAAAWFEWTYTHLQPGLPRFHALPEFRLTAESGAPVSLSDLKGKVWLADFIYTTCPGPCPLISGNLELLQKEALAREDVRFVSITMDPENDTPAVLQKYAERFHAPANKWLFLTGEKQQVQDLVRNGFMLAMVDAQVQANQPIIHSTKIALVDKRGVVRAYYEGSNALQNEQILDDMRKLERE